MVSTVLPRVARIASTAELTLADIDAVRLLLRGDSVIDWHRLNYADHAEVDRFLRLNEFDPDSDEEMARLEDVRSDAVEYLSRAFAMAMADEVAADLPARDLFLVASSHGPQGNELDRLSLLRASIGNAMGLVKALHRACHEISFRGVHRDF